ncbi:MAG TPA: serine/threonine-protein kinase, partial [Labilithrix sp.]
VARFEREAKLLRRMRSPYICGVLDDGRTPEHVPFMVLERLTGETLEALLEREGTLSLEDAAPIFAEVLEALVVAHGAGVVHRDLSPSNVFLHRTADGATITKVLDFGVAKTTTPDANAPRTGNRATMGSLPYVAPEQLGDSANAGPRADLYAVGTMLFLAVSGQMPYGRARGTALVVMKREHDPPSIDDATGEKWPAALRTFLAKTMARSPSKRYPSAEVALAALREATFGKGPKLEMPDADPDATPTLPLDDDRPPRRRR